jgi:hypothetical protein
LLIVILFKLAQPPKILVPIVFTFEEIVILSKLVQLKKALVLILVTEFGKALTVGAVEIVILFKLLQYLKAEPLIVFIVVD